MAYLKWVGGRRVIKYCCADFPEQELVELGNEVGNFFGGRLACGLLLAAPASAQGVKIGILNDQSGVYADYGGKWSYEAALMAVEDFGGSVLGHKIEVISADHQNKPDLGVAIARRWYDVEDVDMITELTTSSSRSRSTNCRRK